MHKFNDIQAWKRGLLLVSILLFLGVSLFAAAEGVVRVRQWIKYGKFKRVEDTYVVDPQSGLRIPRPGWDDGRVRINSAGFRSPDLELSKPRNTVRIAFLGASTTYSAEVTNNESTWPHLVWADLRRAFPKANIEYINAAVPGYVVAQSHKALKKRVEPYDPDIIVIYHATNDLQMNSFDQAKRRGIVQLPAEQALAWPAKYSLLWYLAEKNIRIFTRQRLAGSKNDKLSPDFGALAEPFREDLRALAKSSRDFGALTVLVTFSSRLRAEQSTDEQIEAAVTNLYYMPYLSIPSVLASYQTYNTVIRQVATESNALLVENEDAIPGDGKNFTDSVHFTDEGSRAMANRVTSALLASDRIRGLLSQDRDSQ